MVSFVLTRTLVSFTIIAAIVTQPITGLIVLPQCGAGEISSARGAVDGTCPSCHHCKVVLQTTFCGCCKAKNSQTSKPKRACCSGDASQAAKSSGGQAVSTLDQQTRTPQQSLEQRCGCRVESRSTVPVEQRSSEQRQPDSEVFVDTVAMQFPTTGVQQPSRDAFKRPVFLPPHFAQQLFSVWLN